MSTTKVNTSIAEDRNVEEIAAEEKEELNQLNGRLEYYIRMNRERERKIADADNRISQVQQELQEQKDQHDAIVNDLNRKYRDVTNENLNLKQQTNRSNEKIRDLEKELQQSKQSTRLLQNENDALRTSVADRDVVNLQQKEDIRTKSNALDSALKKIESLQNQLQQKDNLLNSVNERLAEAEQQIQSLQAEVDQHRSAGDQELSQLQDHISDLNDEINQLKQRIESLNLVNEQLQKKLDVKETHEDHINSIVDNLRKNFEDQNKQTVARLEAALTEVGQWKNKTVEYEIKHSDSSSTILQLQNREKYLDKRIRDLESDLDQEKKRPQEEVKKKQMIIQRLKHAFKRKDLEVGGYIDRVIALKAEIETYRRLLDEEEQRLGYKSPVGVHKKRKTNPGVYELGGGGNGDPASVDEYPLTVSSYDPQSEYFTIRNQTTSDVNMSGWRLQSERTKQVFRFPNDKILKSGESMTVYPHTMAPLLPNEKDAIWKAKGNVTDPAGDNVRLIDPDNHVVYVAIVGDTSEEKKDHNTSEIKTDHDGSGVDDSDSGVNGNGEEPLENGGDGDGDDGDDGIDGSVNGDGTNGSPADSNNDQNKSCLVM